MKPSKYIISGGGTGGHIYPAIAIADELKAQDPTAQIVFVGAYGKMEMEKVPQAGYKIHGVWISGLQRIQEQCSVSIQWPEYGIIIATDAKELNSVMRELIQPGYRHKDGRLRYKALIGPRKQRKRKNTKQKTKIITHPREAWHVLMLVLRLYREVV